LIYSSVAKGIVVLAGRTSFSGNFSTIAVQCLQKIHKQNRKESLLSREKGMQRPQ
ncbi:hypothetical protein MKW92_048648, partial [Papaver armeniacum]